MNNKIREILRLTFTNDLRRFFSRIKFGGCLFEKQQVEKH